MRQARGARNGLGVDATLAAWSHGDDWLTRLRAHLLNSASIWSHA